MSPFQRTATLDRQRSAEEIDAAQQLVSVQGQHDTISNSGRDVMTEEAQNHGFTVAGEFQDHGVFADNAELAAQIQQYTEAQNGNNAQPMLELGSQSMAQTCRYVAKAFTRFSLQTADELTF